MVLFYFVVGTLIFILTSIQYRATKKGLKPPTKRVVLKVLNKSPRVFGCFGIPIHRLESIQPAGSSYPRRIRNASKRLALDLSR